MYDLSRPNLFTTMNQYTLQILVGALRDEIALWVRKYHLPTAQKSDQS